MPCMKAFSFVSYIVGFALLCSFENVLVHAAVSTGLCTPNPCLNGGICGETSSGFVCTCINGFIGLNCQVRSDECQNVDSLMCKNGHCKLDADGRPRCVCNGHFGGQFCDQTLDTCRHTSCKGGTCVDTSSGYQCTCPVGTQGKNCQINPQRTAKCLDSCKTNATGSFGGRCWHNNSETVNVGWGYKQPLCSTLEGCFDARSQGYDFIEVQLKPIQMQPNDTLIFHTDVDSALYDYKFVPHIIPVEASSPAAFTTCNTSSATPFANFSWMGPGELKVNASFLHLGTQYFIANVNALHRCEFGLRLNVTVKQNKCFDPLNQAAEMCHGHGRCYTDFDRKAYECACCEGYTGRYCEDEDPCYVQPCHNNGVCSVVKGTGGRTTFRCKCNEGFLGFDCSQTVDYCQNKPCLNSGECISNSTGFMCQCKNGYYGNICQMTDDQCASSPCQNGANCVDGDDEFVCQCRSGFKGTTCEIDINECASNPCHNGTCIDGINGFQCHCLPGYQGTTCETVQVQCSSDLQCNNGKCVKRGGSHECSCGYGFSGSNCQIDIGLCQNSIFCIEENSLACIDHGSNVLCSCTDGFTGSNCGVNVNDCKMNPCQNNGKCVDKVNGVECLCRKGTKGKFCEVSDKTTSLPITTIAESRPPVTTKSQTTEMLPIEIVLDLQLVTDNCPKLKETSRIQAFTHFVTNLIKDACKCTLSAKKVSLGASTILCSDDLNGKFVTKLRVKDKKEEKEIICGLGRRIKKGHISTNDRNTYIVGLNSDWGVCDEKKDDDGPVTVDKTVHENSKKTGIIIGSIVAVIIIIAIICIVSVKFRSRTMYQAKVGNDAKAFLNFAYQSDLELITPKSAWMSPEPTPEPQRNPYALSYSVKKSKKFNESSFSFENPAGATSTV